MKTTILSQHLRRGARLSAAALAVTSLGLASAFAQGTAVSGPTTQGASTNPQAGERDTATTPRTDPSSPTTSGSATTNPSYQSNTAGTQGRASKSEKKFISKVAESSPKEVAIAHLAVERASNPQIKSYAQQIISDHQQMHQDLEQLAQQNGIELPDHLQAGRAGASGTAGTYGSTGARTSGTSTGAMDARMSGSATTGAATTAGVTGSSSTVGSGMGSANVPEAVRSDSEYRELAEKSGAEFDEKFVEAMVKMHKKDLAMFREQADEAEDAQVRQFASKNVTVLEGHLDRAQTLSESVAE